MVVAPPKTIIYPTQGEPFQIKRAKIRGVESNGMICAEDEIGLGTEHDGIIVLPKDAKIGMPASEYYQIENDHILEIGLTPNRADAYSHLGTARDLMAALKVNHGKNVTVKFPDTSSFQVNNKDLEIAVEVKNHEACPRYSGVSITGLKIAESPDWLKTKLNAVGVRPINNVVDITNFILHE